MEGAKLWFLLGSFGLVVSLVLTSFFFFLFLFLFLFLQVAPLQVCSTYFHLFFNTRNRMNQAYILNHLSGPDPQGPDPPRSSNPIDDDMISTPIGDFYPAIRTRAES